MVDFGRFAQMPEPFLPVVLAWCFCQVTLLLLLSRHTSCFWASLTIWFVQYNAEEMAPKLKPQVAFQLPFSWNTVLPWQD